MRNASSDETYVMQHTSFNTYLPFTFADMNNCENFLPTNLFCANNVCKKINVDIIKTVWERASII